MNEFLGVLKKYAVFEGRASRREYWMFQLINFLIYLVLAVIAIAINGGKPGIPPVLLVANLYMLAILIPIIAVSVRRLHDIGKSGGWFFFNFVPIVGGLVVFIFSVMKSQPGPNNYGPNPYNQ